MSSPHQAGKTLLFHALRLGFRMVPMGEAARDRLRQWFVDHYRHLVPEAPQVAVVAPPRIRRSTVRAGEAAIGHRTASTAPLTATAPATLVAFYCPQVHAPAAGDVPQHPQWLDVARALPQFEGHAQPRLPAELGFYDSCNRHTLQQQVGLARSHGIDAFSFHVSCAADGTVGDRALREWLADPTLDFPFCLCLANGTASAVHAPAGEAGALALTPLDDPALIADVAAYLRDPRYLRVDGKPLLLVTHPELLRDPKATVQGWRQWCRANGVGELQVACAQGPQRGDPRENGFDAAVEFAELAMPRNIGGGQTLLNPEFAGEVFDWRELAAESVARSMPPYPLYPVVSAGRDDEPTRPGRGRIYLHAAPRRYRDWLHATLATRLARTPRAQRIVFLDAWNGWTQGAVLEPDARLGHAWLHATRQAVEWAAAQPSRGSRAAQAPCAVIHAWYIDVLEELLDTLQASGVAWRTLITTTAERAAAVRGVLQARGMQAEVLVFPNRGRDILPFLHVANRLLDEGVELLLKLHTKRSPHRADGEAWRQELVSRLASPERAGAILRAFGEDATLGLVGPEGHLQPLEAWWCENSEAVSWLSVRAGMPMLRDDDDFVAGSMFWARLEALRPLLDAHLQDSDFEPESGQLDGTLAHAVERVLAPWAAHAGYRVVNPTALAQPGPAPEPVAGAVAASPPPDAPFRAG